MFEMVINDITVASRFGRFLSLGCFSLISSRMISNTQMTDIEIFCFQCVFTTISSMIGFIANLFVSEEFYLYPNDWKREVEYFWSPEARCWVRYNWRTVFTHREPDWAAAPDWGPPSPWREQPDWGPRSPCHRRSEFHSEHVREELSLVQILAIESFLFFGKSSKNFRRFQ